MSRRKSAAVTPVVSKAASQPRRPRYFRITYSNTAPDAEPKLFHARDGIAFSELTAPLGALGYEFGTTIHFYPDDERRPLGDFPAFTAEDLLVLPTRPPLTDRESLISHRKIIRNSRNDLEKLVFGQFFSWFSYCTRKHVKLTPQALKHLPPEAAKWGSIEFFEHSGATHPYGEAHVLKHMGTRQRPEVQSTVAYLLRVNGLSGVDGVPAIPCGLLASFGMDGYSTLIWNHLVRLRYPQWLTTPSFVMAEILFKQPIPRRPLTIEFASDPAYIEVRILAETRLE